MFRNITENSTGQNILLVEDQFLIAMATRMMLENQGFKVMIATSGEEAINTVNQCQSIHMVLMDINLGDGIDGIETAKIVLKNHAIPLIFLSNQVEQEVAAKTKAVASYGYVTKNTGEVTLVTAINNAFKLFDTNQAGFKRASHSLD